MCLVSCPPKFPGCNTFGIASVMFGAACCCSNSQMKNINYCGCLVPCIARRVNVVEGLMFSEIYGDAHLAFIFTSLLLLCTDSLQDTRKFAYWGRLERCATFPNVFFLVLHMSSISMLIYCSYELVAANTTELVLHCFYCILPITAFSSPSFCCKVHPRTGHEGPEGE